MGYDSTMKNIKILRFNNISVSRDYNNISLISLTELLLKLNDHLVITKDYQTK